MNHFLRKLVGYEAPDISTKLFSGDLLLDYVSSDEAETVSGSTLMLNRDKYVEMFQRWQRPENFIWHRFEADKMGTALNHNVFVIWAESVTWQVAEYLHQELQDFSPYLGALEVDDASAVHWALYTGALSAKLRLMGRNLSVFWDGIDEESKDYELAQDCKELGFQEVSFESLEGIYTIFDG